MNGNRRWLPRARVRRASEYSRGRSWRFSGDVRSGTARLQWSWPSSTSMRGQRKTGMMRAMRCAGSCARPYFARWSRATKGAARRRRGQPPHVGCYGDGGRRAVGGRRTAEGPRRKRRGYGAEAYSRARRPCHSLQTVHSPVRQAQGPTRSEGLTLLPSLNELRRAGAATQRAEDGRR